MPYIERFSWRSSWGCRGSMEWCPQIRQCMSCICANSQWIVFACTVLVKLALGDEIVCVVLGFGRSYVCACVCLSVCTYPLKQFTQIYNHVDATWCKLFGNKSCEKQTNTYYVLHFCFKSCVMGPEALSYLNRDKRIVICDAKKTNKRACCF